jgi:hypothetical protein
VLRLARRNELAYGVAISRDGMAVLAEVGGLETPHRVIAVPVARGKPRVLARNAMGPTWIR